MSKQTEQLQQSLVPWREQLIGHPVYAAVTALQKWLVLWDGILQEINVRQLQTAAA